LKKLTRSQLEDQIRRVEAIAAERAGEILEFQVELLRQRAAEARKADLAIVESFGRFLDRAAASLPKEAIFSCSILRGGEIENHTIPLQTFRQFMDAVGRLIASQPGEHHGPQAED